MSTSTATLKHVVVVVAFIASVLLSLVQPWCGRDRLSATDVAAVVGRHTDLVKAADLIVIHPPWRDDIVAAVAPLLPYHTVTEAFTRNHGDPWPALVVVAEGVHPWPAALEAERQKQRAPIVEDSGVRFFRLAQNDVVSTLQLAQARVSVVDAAGTTTACAWQAAQKAHRCPGLPAWMHVGDEDLPVDGRRQRCTWAHPTTNGRVVIDYGVVDVSRGLRLEAALTDTAARNQQGAPVTISVQLEHNGARDEHSVTVQKKTGFVGTDIPAAPAGTRVSVVVTTPNDGQRHTCFRLGPP
jgi:hypothetical protein